MESEGLRNAIWAQQKANSEDGAAKRRSSANSSEEVLRLVASAERGSEHPLAKVKPGYWCTLDVLALHIL